MDSGSFATLRAELDRQAVAMASLRAEVSRLRRERRRRQPGIAILGALVALLVLSPLGALAANFVDLNPGSGHNADINLIADAGISKGCGDTSHYCPDDYVTREQMASFLARTAGLGSNPPVTNAASLGGIPADGYVQANGDVTLWYSFQGATTNTDTIVMDSMSFPHMSARSTTVNASGDVQLHLPRPTNLFGRTLLVSGVEICFRTTTDAEIERTAFAYVNYDANNVPATHPLMDDQTDRSSIGTGTCYTLQPNAPMAVDGMLYLLIELKYYNSQRHVYFDRVRLTLTPQ